VPVAFDRPAKAAESAGMALHLIKLCVGAESLDDLTDWISRRLAARRKAKEKPEHKHVTRMMPTRRAELLEGGSLYWVIKGQVQGRQRLADIRPFIDEEGISRCQLVLTPEVVPTVWRPKRPFQGWRYLDGKAAPADLAETGDADMPPALKAELAELGLL
jgi:hypothetical protein